MSRTKKGGEQKVHRLLKKKKKDVTAVNDPSDSRQSSVNTAFYLICRCRYTDRKKRKTSHNFGIWKRTITASI